MVNPGEKVKIIHHKKETTSEYHDTKDADGEALSASDDDCDDEERDGHNDYHNGD